MRQWSTSVSLASINCRTSAVVRICNPDVDRAATSVAYRRAWFALRKRRWRLILLACALLAAGCAHQYDSSSDDSQAHPHGHFAHPDPNLETETETSTSYAKPSPSPGGF